MSNIFEIVDKTGRKIRLTSTQFDHVLRHTGMEQHIEDIKQTLANPLKLVPRTDG